MLKRHGWLALLALALVLTGPARASAQEETSPASMGSLGNFDFDLTETQALEEEDGLRMTLGGYLESRNQVRLKDGDAISLRQRLWLEPSLDWGKVRFFASGSLDLDSAAVDHYGRDSELLDGALSEAYLTLDTEYLDVIAGQKTVRWGTGDGVNPMDLINPVDLRDPMSGARSDSRLPVPLVQVMALASPLTLEAVYIPLGRVNDLPPTGCPWEALGLKTLRQMDDRGDLRLERQDTPDEILAQSEVALRVSTTFSNCDLALQYFNGFQDTPVFHVETKGGEFVITPRHPRQQAFGINFAKGFERSTVRGELAWKPDMALQQKDMFLGDHEGVVKRDVYEGVIGWDHTFFTDLYVNLQYFATVVEDGDLETSRKTFTDGVTFKISDKFLNNDLEAGVQGMAYFENSGWSAEAYGKYEYDDHWTVTPGVMVLGGDADSALGQYRDNSMAYLKIRYSF